METSYFPSCFSKCRNVHLVAVFTNSTITRAAFDFPLLSVTTVPYRLCGCYNHLSGGTQTEAMEDVTGGICETLMLTPKDRPKDLQEQMEKYAKRCCLMGCSVDVSSNY